MSVAYLLVSSGPFQHTTPVIQSCFLRPWDVSQEKDATWALAFPLFHHMVCLLNLSPPPLFHCGYYLILLVVSPWLRFQADWVDTQRSRENTAFHWLVCRRFGHILCCKSSIALLCVCGWVRERKRAAESGHHCERNKGKKLQWSWQFSSKYTV